LIHAYNPWVVRRSDRENRYWRRGNYNMDWDNDDWFDWNADVDYVMGTDGKLIEANKVVVDSTGVYEKRNEKDKLKELEEKEKKNENERQQIEREKQKILDKNITDSNSTGYKPKNKQTQFGYINVFTPLII